MAIGKLSFGDVVSAVYPIQDVLGREINPTVYKENKGLCGGVLDVRRTSKPAV